MDELSKSLGHRYYRESCFDREQLIEGSRPTIEPTTHTRNFPEKERLKLVLPELPGDPSLNRGVPAANTKTPPLKKRNLPPVRWRPSLMMR